MNQKRVVGQQDPIGTGFLGRERTAPQQRQPDAASVIAAAAVAKQKRRLENLRRNFAEALRQASAGEVSEGERLIRELMEALADSESGLQSLALWERDSG